MFSRAFRCEWQLDGGENWYQNCRGVSGKTRGTRSWTYRSNGESLVCQAANVTTYFYPGDTRVRSRTMQEAPFFLHRQSLAFICLTGHRSQAIIRIELSTVTFSYLCLLKLVNYTTVNDAKCKYVGAVRRSIFLGVVGNCNLYPSQMQSCPE